MSSWRALNIESDDSSDSEVDDIKEIHIEEALKDYQTALRLHSQGKPSYPEAQQAYDTLFKSEIFRYNESLSEYARAETFADQLDEYGTYLVDIGDTGNGAQAGVDAGPSTLPQILHLSYKNRGQFYLEKLQSQLKEAVGKQSESVVAQARSALIDFAEALDKDELDIDLWRRAAKISKALGSSRMTRYCLESALEDEVEDGTDEVLGMPSIEATLTGKDLKQVQRELGDDLSVKQLLPLAAGQLQPSAYIEEKLKLYPLLPERLVEPVASGDEDEKTLVLFAEERTWQGIGSAILKRLEEERRGTNLGSASVPVRIEFAPPSAPQEPTVRADPPGTPKPSVARVASETTDEKTESVEPALQVVTTQAVPLNDTVEQQTPIKEEPASDKPKDDQATPGGEMRSSSRPGTARKRSTHEAENEDSGRGRSKRIRARESIVAPENTNTEADLAVNPTLVAAGLEENKQADHYLFEILSAICKQAGVSAFYEPRKLRTLVANQESGSGIPLELAIKDFYQAMMTWDDDKTALLAKPESSEQESVDNSRDTGLAAFLESAASASKPAEATDLTDGVEQFVETVATHHLNLADVAAAWLSCLLDPRAGRRVGLSQDSSSYIAHTWTEGVKHTVQSLVDILDDPLFATLEQEATSSLKVLGPEEDQSTTLKTDLVELVTFLQTLYEIHVDTYTTPINPQNTPDSSRRQQTKAKVDKWGVLTRHFMPLLLEGDEPDQQAKQIAFRHLWASTFEMRAFGDASREELLRCIDELRRVARTDGYDLYLPNNSTMRHLSVTAADQEITKLETMDFFLSVFSRDRKDPVDLIERLEPVLMMTQQQQQQRQNKSADANDDVAMENGERGSVDSESRNKPASSASVLSEFLANASFSLRLSLWKRLRESYQAIDYPPKVLTIDLKSIELILDEFKSPDFAELDADKRQTFIISQLYEIEDLLKKIAEIIEKYRDGLECLDVESLCHTMASLAEIWTLLHTVTLFDDHNQVLQKGIDSINPFRTYQDERFHGPAIKFHEMQIRIYILWYKLLLQAISETAESFASPLELRWDYLRHIHHALGVRRLCKASDSLFLKFMKGELELLSAAGHNCDDEQAQILYDLYDLFCWVQPLSKQDHGCDSDYLDRATAKDLVDFVLDKAKNLPIKELMKIDLGKTVDKLHTALGANATSSSITMQRNKKLLLNYLKQPLDPYSLYRALAGALELSVVPVCSEEAPLAAKGWLFLRAQMTFARYKVSKGKGQPGDLDDLEEAIGLFLQDLEYDSERWETWYALAKSYDAFIEEKVVWSAEKLNTPDGRSMLAQYQRNSIHSYAMAVAIALRVIGDDEKSKDRLAELYFDFGMRVYASSRPPFTMGAFSLREFPERFASSWNGVELYKRRSFKTMKAHHAWNFAKVLFERADALKPDQWLVHYMLGKCSWKLFMMIIDQEENFSTDHAQRALDYFLGAIERLPDKKSDKKSEEPILEPIYKTVAALHKLTSLEVLPGDDAFDTIDHLLRGQNQFDVSKRPKYDAQDGFTAYASAIFKLLRNADKSKWHHRVVFRGAQVMFEKGGRDEAAARAAKDYLLEQHMYSQKTLGLTIWKPENERAGRHWVYMSRYTEFLLDLLDATSDYEAMQILSRRVRKKPAEFFEHDRVWQKVVDTVLRMYRRLGDIPEEAEDAVFKTMTTDEFGPKAEQVDAWMVSPESTHPLIDVARELAEMKKINAGLALLVPIDNLIADAYATMFERVLPGLPKAVPAVSSGAAPAAAAPAAAAAPPPPPPPPPNQMSIISMMNVDGSTEAKTSAATTPTQLPVPVPSDPPKRIKLVTRREVLKHCTEAAATKTAAVAIKSSRAAERVVPLAEGGEGGAKAGEKRKRASEEDGGEDSARESAGPASGSVSGSGSGSTAPAPPPPAAAAAAAPAGGGEEEESAKGEGTAEGEGEGDP